MEKGRSSDSVVKQVLNAEGLTERNKRTQEIFAQLVESSKENLIADKELMPVAFLLAYDHTKSEYTNLIFPMLMQNDHDKDMMAHVLKEVVKSMRASSNMEPIALITMMECFISKIDGKGRSTKEILNDPNYVRPSEDPKAREALVFVCEEEFKKRTIMYEFMRTDPENEIIIQDTPMSDETHPYDEKISGGRFAFLFTKPGASSN